MTLAAQVNAFFVDDPSLYSNAYREALGATLQWQHDFQCQEPVQRLCAVRAAHLSRPGRCATRTATSAAWATRTPLARTDVVAYVGLYGGAEQEKDDSFPQFGHDLYGARIGAQQFLN